MNLKSKGLSLNWPVIIKVHNKTPLGPNAGAQLKVKKKDDVIKTARVVTSLHRSQNDKDVRACIGI